MFLVKLNKIKIDKRRELIGKAEVQLIVFVNDGTFEMPGIDRLIQEIVNPEEKKKIIQGIARNVKAKMEFPEIHKVPNNLIIRFGEQGTNVFVSEKIPNTFTLSIYAIENDQKTRTNAALVKDILNDETIDQVGNIVTSMAEAATPVTAIVSAVLKIVVPVVTKVFAKDKDDQVGVFITSLNKFEHYSDGKYVSKYFEGDMSGNMKVMFSVFGKDE